MAREIAIKASKTLELVESAEVLGWHEAGRGIALEVADGDFIVPKGFRISFDIYCRDESTGEAGTLITACWRDGKLTISEG